MIIVISRSHYGEDIERLFDRRLRLLRISKTAVVISRSQRRGTRRTNVLLAVHKKSAPVLSGALCVAVDYLTRTFRSTVIVSSSFSVET
jgi:hypothetical protein